MCGWFWLQLVEAALQTVSSVALLAENNFGKYYDAMMPGIKGLFVSSRNNRDLRELRAKCMECIGIIGKAVGKEKFLKDGKEIMDMLMQQTGMSLCHLFLSSSPPLLSPHIPPPSRTDNPSGIDLVSGQTSNS